MNRGIHGIKFLSLGVHSATRVQFLNKPICISYNISLEKGMNPTVLPPIGQTGLFNLGMATGLEGKLNSNQN